MKIVESVYINDLTYINRTWIERLFTFPWEPFKKWEVKYDPKIYKTNDTIICSPETAAKLRRELKNV